MFLEWTTDERGVGARLCEGERPGWSLIEGPDGEWWVGTDGSVSVLPRVAADGLTWNTFRDHHLEALAPSLGDRSVVLREGVPLHPARVDDEPLGPRESDDLDF